MTAALRVLFLLVLVALAGCTVGITDSPAADAETPTPGTLPDANGTNLTLPSAERVSVEVTNVVDGDTIDVRLPDGSEDTVRLLGVDTPEVYADNSPTEFEGVPDSEAGAECLRDAGEDSTAYATEQLETGNITLVFDPNADRRGGYGRLLAYVTVDGRNLNYDLVATGHARVYDTDFGFRDSFDAAEQHARDHQRGLWRCQRAG
ncbi:thermonuclease family protein [Salinibaculum salinum]|uniref:thermonuclease family protein n=1 Tax=Salinibaculum salinum TaxID=3131996 RepID=UPI0030EB3DE8